MGLGLRNQQWKLDLDDLLRFNNMVGSKPRVGEKVQTGKLNLFRLRNIDLMEEQLSDVLRRHLAACVEGFRSTLISETCS